MQYKNNWEGQGQVVSKHRVEIDDPRQTYQVTDLNVSFRRKVKGVWKITVIPCEAWGKFSEACDNIQDGDWVSVIGRFENKEWKLKNGEICRKNLIVVEGLEPL